jgi:hypothetical protein
MPMSMSVAAGTSDATVMRAGAVVAGVFAREGSDGFDVWESEAERRSHPPHETRMIRQAIEQAIEQQGTAAPKMFRFVAAAR